MFCTCPMLCWSWLSWLYAQRGGLHASYIAKWFWPILVLHIVYRFVKWLRDLDPTFCWPIFLDGEIRCCSVLKFPQSVLWKSSYCQMWYLGILCEDNTKGGRSTKIKLVLPLLQIGTWRILWLWVSLDLVLFSIWHTTLPVCQGPVVDIPLLNRYFYSRPASSANCDLLVWWWLTWIWHVIDTDKEN